MLCILLVWLHNWRTFTTTTTQTTLLKYVFIFFFCFLSATYLISTQNTTFPVVVARFFSIIYLQLFFFIFFLIFFLKKNKVSFYFLLNKIENLWAERGTFLVFCFFCERLLRTDCEMFGITLHDNGNDSVVGKVIRKFTTQR